MQSFFVLCKLLESKKRIDQFTWVLVRTGTSHVFVLVLLKMATFLAF